MNARRATRSKESEVVFWCLAVKDMWGCHLWWCLWFIRIQMFLCKSCYATWYNRNVENDSKWIYIYNVRSIVVIWYNIVYFKFNVFSFHITLYLIVMRMFCVVQIGAYSTCIRPIVPWSRHLFCLPTTWPSSCAAWAPRTTSSLTTTMCSDKQTPWNGVNVVVIGLVEYLEDHPT